MTKPTTTRTPPTTAHIAWPLMALPATVPVPWPIQIKPTSSRTAATARRDLRMARTSAIDCDPTWVSLSLTLTRIALQMPITADDRIVDSRVGSTARWRMRHERGIATELRPVEKDRPNPIRKLPVRPLDRYGAGSDGDRRDVCGGIGALFGLPGRAQQDRVLAVRREADR